MRKIAFLSGTRADFGKIKSLMRTVLHLPNFELKLFVTGMHLDKKYGYTVEEIFNSEFKDSIFQYINKSHDGRMDISLANTIKGFSEFVLNNDIDLIVVHGDRPESLAAAIVGSFNNILVAHVEGGEVSGTIDEMIRHSTSKLSHYHFVSNSEAKGRLIRLGENPNSIKIIGNPDLDILLSDKLPSKREVFDHYAIDFDHYAIIMFHPVTTEFDFKLQSDKFVKAIKKIKENFIVIYPNNDSGSQYIIDLYEKELRSMKNIKIFPSLRFEFYLTLLKFSKFILGNSSSGIHEAPYFKIPTINVGTRQNSRSSANTILNVNANVEEILKACNSIDKINFSNNINEFGTGDSYLKFKQTISSDAFWKTPLQKSIWE